MDTEKIIIIIIITNVAILVTIITIINSINLYGCNDDIVIQRFVKFTNIIMKYYYIIII